MSRVVTVIYYLNGSRMSDVSGSPFVSAGIVAFDVIDSGDTIETTNSKHHVVNDFDAEVAAWAVHVVDGIPRVGRRIIAFSVVQSSDTIKAACSYSNRFGCIDCIKHQVVLPDMKMAKHRRLCVFHGALHPVRKEFVSADN